MVKEIETLQMLAECDNILKMKGFGSLGDDGEDIVVVEVDFKDLNQLISTGELEDQMSIAALLSAQHVYTQHIMS